MGMPTTISVKQNGHIDSRLVLLTIELLTQMKLDPFFRREGVFWEAWEASAPYELKPSIEGLIFIDLDTKWMGGGQSFTSLSTFYVGLDAPQEVEGLWDAGRIHSIAALPPAQPIALSIDTTYDHFMGLAETCIKESQARGVSTCLLGLRLPLQWSLSEALENNDAWKDICERVANMDVPLTKKEMAGWEKYFRQKHIPIAYLSPFHAQQSAHALQAHTPHAVGTLIKPRI